MTNPTIGPDAATGQMAEGILRQEGFVYSNHDGFWCWLATSERWGMTWSAIGGLEMFTNGHATPDDVHTASNRMYLIERALAGSGGAGAEGESNGKS